MLAGETTAGPEAGEPVSPWWVLAMQEASHRTVGESFLWPRQPRWRAVSIRTGPAPTMRGCAGTAVECGIGGVAASWFSEMRANARPARGAGSIVRLPQFCSSWADEGGPSTGAQSARRTPSSEAGRGQRSLGRHWNPIDRLRARTSSVRRHGGAADWQQPAAGRTRTPTQGPGRTRTGHGPLRRR
jgi:hypothetical protein